MVTVEIISDYIRKVCPQISKKGLSVKASQVLMFSYIYFCLWFPDWLQLLTHSVCLMVPVFPFRLDVDFISLHPAV